MRYKKIKFRHLNQESTENDIEQKKIDEKEIKKLFIKYLKENKAYIKKLTKREIGKNK